MSAESWTYTILGIVVIAVIGFWLYLETQAKYKVRIKEVVKGRKVIHDFKAKPVTDDNNVNWWKLMGEKDKSKRLMPLPPERAVELDKKGKKCVEAYRFEDGTIVWSVDVWDCGTYPEAEAKVPDEIQKKIDAEKDAAKKKQIKDDWLKQVRITWGKENKIIAPNEPITTQQRMLYLNNIKKAQARKGFDWKSQLIPIASIAAIALVLIALMIFWGDIAAPALQADNIVKGMQETNLQMLQIIKDIKTGQQTIDDRLTNIENEKGKAPN